MRTLVRSGEGMMRRLCAIFDQETVYESSNFLTITQVPKFQGCRVARRTQSHTSVSNLAATCLHFHTYLQKNDGLKSCAGAYETMTLRHLMDEEFRTFGIFAMRTLA